MLCNANMRFQSRSGSPFVPCSNAFTESRLRFLNSPRGIVELASLRVLGEGEAGISRISLMMQEERLESVSSRIFGIEARGHGVIASMSST
jgi:hypothetical protein